MAKNLTKANFRDSNSYSGGANIREAGKGASESDLARQADNQREQDNRGINGGKGFALSKSIREQTTDATLASHSSRLLPPRGSGSIGEACILDANGVPAWGTVGSALPSMVGKSVYMVLRISNVSAETAVWDWPRLHS